MPIKKPKIHHRIQHSRHKRTKHYLKVYAPYIPLLFFVSVGVFLSFADQARQPSNMVLSYANEMSSEGLLDATNSQRLSAGSQPLQADSKLAQAAQAKANDMAEQNYWSHTTPDGKDPWFFIERAGYKYFKAAENLAYGFPTSDSAVNGWMNSPSHRANLLDNSLREVGFGIANISDYQGSGPQTLVVAMYGLPVGSTSPALLNQQPTSGLTPSKDATVLPSEEQKITRIQALTGGNAPWSSFVAGLAIGLIAMYLLIKHMRTLRRAVFSSERFIIQHPLLDSTLVALAALGLILSQTAGKIY